MSAIRGVVPAALTAWRDDEEYDPRAQERYVAWLLDNGAEGIAVTGSTGEMLAMQPDEQESVIDHVTRFVAGQVPVLASVGTYGTRETLRLARAAQKSGVDQIMVIAPYYYKPYPQAALRHVRDVHALVDVPICLYNNPNFSGYEITPQQVADLFEADVIVSTKCAHGDPARVADLRVRCGGISIFYGHDYSPVGAYAAGADGWFSGLGSAFPAQCRDLQRALRDEGDLVKARGIWRKFLPFVEYLMDPATGRDVHWLEIFKYAVAYRGVSTGTARRPLVELTELHKRRVEPLIDELIS